MASNEKLGPSDAENKEKSPTDSNNDIVSKYGQARIGFFQSPGVKFVLVGLIIIALLVPAIMVWGLVEERAGRAKQVAGEIAQGWGGVQTINGPYLVIPYNSMVKVGRGLQQVTKYAIISSKSLAIDGKIDVRERKKSIYKTQLYNVNAKLEGAFDPIDLSKIEKLGGVPIWDAAYIILGVSDLTGFRSSLEISLDGGKAQPFEPGLGGLTYKAGARYGSSSGVQLPVSKERISNGFRFAMDLGLNGAFSLSVVPAGKTTRLSLESNWPHPGFEGSFLPEHREITEKGFKAVWTIPHLARGIEAVSLMDQQALSQFSSMRVNFVEPLKFYQITARSVKYAIGIFSLIFLAIFVLEMTGSKSLHWIQYILAGLAMVVFYILLLALAEQIGFTLAYIASAIVTTALIAWYVGNALNGRNSKWIMGTVLATTYLLMFLILNEEEYALLAGALIAFVAIAGTMIATRKIDWGKAVHQSSQA